MSKEYETVLEELNGEIAEIFNVGLLGDRAK